MVCVDVLLPNFCRREAHIGDLRPRILGAITGFLAPYRRYQWPNTHYLQHPFEIVGQDMQAHLCAHMFQSPHQKMHGPHPGLDRAKGVLHRTAPNTHTVGHTIHAIFHRLHYRFVLPAFDPPIDGCRTLLFQSTAWASRTPIAMDSLTFVLGRESIDQSLSCRAFILIVVGSINKVPPTK